MFGNQDESDIPQGLKDAKLPDPVIHPTDNQTPNTADSPDFSNVASSNNIANDLIEIKRQALSQLAPLLKHLDQTPEDKFRTTMMMIQASDDQTLVKTAYEAALGISDEKTRAQALLDIVNEINYFTQPTVEKA